VVQIALTGIKPTGTPHIGNYLGMIKPALELVQSYGALYFIATWLALGLDPEKVVFFRQSDVPEVFELTWILACLTSKGLLNRAHAYKAAIDENIRQGKSEDDNINAGLYNYPVLMAADILLFGTHVVPVGQDQKQHVEIVRDVASSFNSQYGKVFTIPEDLIRIDVMSVPGVDGRKMSKTYRNTIPIFADDQVIRRQIMGIVTDSKTPEAPKNPEACNVFSLYRYFAPPKAVEETRRIYLRGGARYSDIKKELIVLLLERFKEGRRTYEVLLRDKLATERILKQGAATARSIAEPILTKVRHKIGIDQTDL